MDMVSAKYQIEIDSSDKDSWNEIIELFSDANIYQTWAWGEVRSGKAQVSHILLKRDAHIVAAAQARIFKIRNINAGVAYVRWGPIWRRIVPKMISRIYIKYL